MYVIRNNNKIDILQNGLINKQLFDISGNVFVFIDYKLFNIISENNIENFNCFAGFDTDDNNVSVEQMFNEKVLFIKYTDAQEIHKLVNIIQLYMDIHRDDKLNYLILNK